MPSALAERAERCEEHAESIEYNVHSIMLMCNACSVKV